MSGLTLRTKRVLFLILAGNSNEEIARICKIQRNTLHVYLAQMREELGIKHERQLFPMAERLMAELTNTRHS